MTLTPTDYSGFSKELLVDTWLELLKLDWTGRSDIMYAETIAIRDELLRRAPPTQDAYNKGEWFGGYYGGK